MVDGESVRRRLREIDRRLGLLEGIRVGGRGDFLGDLGLQAQAERHLQLAIQAAIAIALHVVAENSAATPESYGSAFAQLAEIGVVEQDLAAHLRLATGLRNILVHAYLDVDPSRVWEHLGRLDDLRGFVLAVERHLGPA